jgi:hypothetical protein
MKGALLFAVVVATIAVVIAPAFLLNPFAPQTPRDLAVVGALKNAAPFVTIGALVLAAWLAYALWRTWWRKTLVVLALIVLAGMTWLARQNHFEWMFKPLTNAAYADSAAATFVEADDMVLAVRVGNDAAAYPIRQLAYHHIVHDAVGGVPIVVTY